MLNRVYRLASPRLFEPVETEIDLNQSEVIVRPTYLSICNADQRYYRGLRDPQVLAKKLPMALIHEGIGEVVADRTGGFRRGERVVCCPMRQSRQMTSSARTTCGRARFLAVGSMGSCKSTWLSPRAGSSVCRTVWTMRSRRSPKS